MSSDVTGLTMKVSGETQTQPVFDRSRRLEAGFFVERNNGY